MQLKKHWILLIFLDSYVNFFGRLSGNLFQMESLRSQLLTTVLRCLPQHKNNRKVSVIAVSYSLNKKKTDLFSVVFQWKN